MQVRGITKGNVQNPGPHLYKIAEDAFQSLKSDFKSQSIIITGESGAGKTEACKIVLGYLAQAGNESFSGDPDADLSAQRTTKGIESYILDSNPLLEAFGNAKTFRNANSSRFGKFLDIKFRIDSGRIYSANIVTYLLEKSRVISN